MSRLFISHSGSNNAEAVAIRDWLAEAGWRDIFLDLDPDRGIKAGESWEKALNEAAERCEAVIFVISQAWLDSEWCLEEFNLARHLHKALFGVIITTATNIDKLPERLKGTWQVVDLAAGRDHRVFEVILPLTHEAMKVTFSREGLARLRNGLVKAGLEARFFDWPPQGQPDRPPYRGLRPLEAEDAGIFFGRDASIAEARDRLRGLHEAAAPRLLVILGASGAGKSSFLRAGLLPRLARDDRNFLPLPVIRPERAGLTGESGLVSKLDSAFAAHRVAQPRAEIRAAVAGGAEKLRPLLQRLVDTAFARTLAKEDGAKPPALVLAIDQAEELFLRDGHAEADALLALVRDLVAEDRPETIVIFAIRSSLYDSLETATALEGMRQQTLPLLPMPRGAYQTVIEGPAARFGEAPQRQLAVEPKLTQRLLDDIGEGGGRDPLPLLAFTLEQLYLEYGIRRGELRLADYEAVGGIKGAIEEAVDRALLAADADQRIPRDRDARLILLRRGLIPWLAGIDPQTGAPRRRIAHLTEVPAESEPLIHLLVEQRLLSIDRISVRDGDHERHEVTIEPAHEALLRQWGLLKGWLEEDFAALATLEGVKRAATEWHANNHLVDWLNHTGIRLDAAEKFAAQPDFTAYLSADEHDYLRRCRERDEANRREREEALELDRTRRAEVEMQRVQTLFGLAALQQSRGNLDGALRLAVYAARRELALDKRERPPIAGPELVRAVCCCAWRFVLDGHRGAINFAAFSPDETRIVTVADDKTARIWDASNGREIAVLGDRELFVNSAAFSPDGGQIVTACEGGIAPIWDAETGTKIAVLRGAEEAKGLFSAAFSPNGARVVAASREMTARIWDTASGNEIAVLRGHGASINSAAFSPDGLHVLTLARFDHPRIRVWDALNGKLIAVLGGRDFATYSPDGKRILTGGASVDQAQIWDAANLTEVAELRGHKDLVVAAAYSPDGKCIVTASNDKTARVWNASSGKEIAVLRGHGSFVCSAAFSPDGRRIVTGSSDKTARVWDAVSGKGIAVLRGHRDAVTRASFKPGGLSIITASQDRRALVWDIPTANDISILVGHADQVLCAAFSPDGTLIVTGGNDRTARIWDAASGRQIAVLWAHTESVDSVAFSPDGTRIVAATNNGVMIWDQRTGSDRVFLNRLDDVNSACFSPHGTQIITASDDKAARIWDVASGREIVVLRGHERSVRSAAYSPDGRSVVTGSADGTARIWDVASGREIVVLRGHERSVRSAAYSPDGRSIVTGSADGTAWIWDAVSAEKIAILGGHESSLNSAMFSPDGNRIVTASGDTTARVWDVASAREIEVLSGHENDATAAAFSPEGTRIVTASRDNTARIWDVHFTMMSTLELITEACTRQLFGIGKLTREEMRLAGYPDTMPEIDVCVGAE